ncbi:MAG: hypothetical protein AAFN78_13845 [Pseudomonadota bacterium]
MRQRLATGAVTGLARAALALMSLLTLSAAAAEPETWRVAGILQGAGGGVAIMESSIGEQALFRPGDEVADARVAAISDDHVTLELGGRELKLELRGAAHALVANGSAPATAGAKTTQPVAGRYAVQRLQQLLNIASDDSELQRGATALFRLPPGATITGVNHDASMPVRPALKSMVEYLQLGRTVSLEFDAGSGPESVYIYPE